jgi:hypothetical protein
MQRVDIHAHPESAAAHIAHERPRLRLDVPQAGDQVLPHRGAARHQVLVFDHKQGLQRHCRGQRVAAEGGAVAAGAEDVHDPRIGQERADGQQAAAQRLAEDQCVRPDAFMLEGKHAPGAAQPRLHLVDHQQDVVAGAPVTQLREEARRRHDDAGLALDRLDQHRAGIGARGGAHARHAAEVEVAKARRERTEAGPVLRLARESDDGRRAAVEVLPRHQDLGLSERDSLVAVAPAPRALDRRLHGFRARVHRQRALETGDRAELFQERSERRPVVRPRGHRHALELAVRGGDQPGVQVAMAHGGIRTHHVDVFAAFDVPNQAIAGPVHDHRDRLIVSRPETRFLPNEILRVAGVHGRSRLMEPV